MALSEFLFEKMTGKLGFEPTVCQQSLFRDLSEFVLIGESSSSHIKRLMVINGYAGTGKTSSIAALVSVLKEFGRNVILMAPTGRA
ncbi:MAG: AAA family ATPase, partial [Bacteroidales bacterium]|nr:AAA family ATPase [Bacteroidales bacterium]